MEIPFNYSWLLAIDPSLPNKKRTAGLDQSSFLLHTGDSQKCPRSFQIGHTGRNTLLLFPSSNRYLEIFLACDMQLAIMAHSH